MQLLGYILIGLGVIVAILSYWYDIGCEQNNE